MDAAGATMLDLVHDPHPHSDSHADSHAHGSDARAASASRNQRRLWIALALAASYMGAEIVGGLLTGSLALLADAGHMLSDVFALGMSIAALRIAQLPPNPRRTYGYLRSEILAALGHGVLLVCVSVFIFVEAFERASAPVEVDGGPMLLVASGGLLVNAAALWILHGGTHENLNVRGAWLHVLSDALGSIGAIAAGAAIWLFGWYWADTVASLLIGTMVVYSSWALLREALAVLMESAPRHIDVEEVRAALGALRGVIDVHDVHVWTVGTGLVSLSGHVVAKDGFSDGGLLREIDDLLSRRFRIEHTTIQIESIAFAQSDTACCE